MSTLKEKAEQILDEKSMNIIPENIKNGVQIFDIIGSYAGSISIPEEAKITNGNYLFQQGRNQDKCNIWADLGLFGQLNTAIFMFSGITTNNIDFSKIDFSYCNNMGSMFEASTQLTSLNCSDINVRMCSTFDNMFDDCFNLEDIDISSWNMINAYGVNNMFKNCTRLSNASLNSILKAFQTCNLELFISMGNNNTLYAAGLTQEQAQTCTTLSNWNDLASLGWTTGY